MDIISKSGPSAGGTTSMLHIFQSCNDTSDAVDLFGPQQLYLKPVARLNISVQLPQLKQPGKTISNWEVMERLKNMVKPTEFIVLKVSKSTLEFIRFEGEIESKSNLEGVVSRLDGRTIKLSGFSDLLKVRAAEAKASFPTRHTWDSYFRDAKNMNEMKPGERPDTIHITNLPCKWFSSKHDLAHGSDLPSEYIFRKVFEQFGEVRCVDIPLLDPYRNLMKAQISGMKTFSFGQGLAFEGYVQFQEYVCFVKAMDALRGMKLLHKEGDKAFTASIKVDFDKTKHLSEASIRRRKQEREHLMANEREVEERERRAKEAQEREAEALRNKEREKQQMKEERRRQREERRKAKHLKRIKEEETRVMNKKIAVEERKLVIAQRKLESIRLLDELFERVKMKIQKEKVASKLPDATKESTKVNENSKESLSMKERELRQRLLKKYKSVQEKLLEEQREKLRRTVEGKTRLQSVATKPSEKEESDSDSSSSKKSSSRRSGKNGKRSDDRRSNSADRRYDWYHGMPGIPPVDLTAYVQAYGFQSRFPSRFQERVPYRDGLYRQRGRDYGRWQRYPKGRNVPSLYYGQLNEEYYKYFRKVARKSRSRSISRSKTRSRSRSRSKSKSRGRSRSRSKSRSKSRSRSNKRSKSPRYRSKFDRSRSTAERSRSVNRNRSKSRSRNRSRSGSRGGKRKSSSKSRTSPGRRNKSRSRSPRRKSNLSRDRHISKSKRSRSSSPKKRNSRRSCSPSKRHSGSASRRRSKERTCSKKSLRSLSRELSLSLSPADKRKTEDKSDRKTLSKEKQKNSNNVEAKNSKDKQNAN